jgi:hypothetical protein
VSGRDGREGRSVRVRGVRVAGTTLYVSVLGSRPVDGGPADLARRGYQAEVAETDDLVELDVREQLPDVDLPAGQAPKRVGHAYLLSVRLARPLAGRPVIDRSTGSPVTVFRRVLTVPPDSGWRPRSESAQGPTWTQMFTGPRGEFVVNHGPSQIGVVSHPTFFERTGVTSVRGVSAEWGSTPGETSVHWVEDGDGVQLMSPDLPLDTLVEIANGLVAAE